jgi:hypothetical protein
MADDRAAAGAARKSSSGGRAEQCRLLAQERRRDGAYEWGVFEDVAEEGRFLETFLVESWLEHLRQHERVTNADRFLHSAVHRFQTQGMPKVAHFVAAPREAHAPKEKQT